MRLRRCAALALLFGTALPLAGPAVAAPSQDERFLTLLGQRNPAAVPNAPELITQAHRVCDQLDGGAPFRDLVERLTNGSDEVQSGDGAILPRTSSIVKFIAAAATIYCPQDRDQLP